MQLGDEKRETWLRAAKWVGKLAFAATMTWSAYTVGRMTGTEEARAVLASCAANQAAFAALHGQLAQNENTLHRVMQDLAVTRAACSAGAP